MGGRLSNTPRGYFFGGRDDTASKDASRRALEGLTTRWRRHRAKAVVGMPSVANIRWHDLRGTFGSRPQRNVA
jgi:hypothetical protein